MNVSGEIEIAAKDSENGMSPVQIGIMIENSSAVWITDRLAKEVYFFSISMKDLMQYPLGHDRENLQRTNLHTPAVSSFSSDSGDSKG